MTPGTENYPTVMGWRYAAIYCNWLCNGKAHTASAFASGAYDINTFTTNPDGTVNDQLTHSAGAQFWTPTLSEWVKGAYYDPNRYGAGLEGYWRSPNGTNNTLVSGAPGTGQTNAGIASPGVTTVGSYPEVQSPWGLLDVSGGVSEWTELPSSGSATNRLVMGSRYRSPTYVLEDHPDYAIGYFDAGLDLAGVRIASLVPSPAPPFVLGLGMALLFTRRKRA
jgi:hypothetical protein